MFVASAPFGLFDYLRVPYRVAAPPDAEAVGAVGALRREAAGTEAPAMMWVRDGGEPRHRHYSGTFSVAGLRLAGTVTTEHPHRLLAGQGRDWHRTETVSTGDGREISAVWTSDRGDIFLPFDPGAVMTCLWSEAYTRLGVTARVRSAGRHSAVRAYYALRPALPRSVQLVLRRRLARDGAVPSFPSWPLETGLHDMYTWLLGLTTALAGCPVPYIAPWPDGHDWCFVLTHDVETAQGCADIHVLREPERRHGYRSSWNFVPLRYDTPSRTVDGLVAEGCEVGVHGLKHDGRDLASERVLRSRLPAMRAAAAGWGATGFRSPATQRGWDLMPRLGFDYDSSYTDTDPYEPQPGGCCTYLPFFNRELVELPITLPQDHTLFSVLGHRDGTLWLEKAKELRRRGGLVLVLSHPDYAHGPALTAWEALLEEFDQDQTMWQPLPREAAAWWRARAASVPVPDAGGWRIAGPAAARGRVVEAARLDSHGVA